MSVLVNQCKRKGECHNYPNQCDLCIISSDSVNPHPYFEDRDLVEVVRCRECVKRKTPDCAMYYECSKCGSQHTWESSNAFCSFGKRKDDAGEKT